MMFLFARWAYVSSLQGTVFFAYENAIAFFGKVPGSVLSHAHSSIEGHEVLQDFGVLASSSTEKHIDSKARLAIGFSTPGCPITESGGTTKSS